MTVRVGEGGYFPAEMFLFLFNFVFMGIESFEFAFYLSTVYGDGPKAGRPFRRREHAVLILFMKIGQRSFLPPKSPV